MTSSIRGGLCRVTIVAPDGRVDVAMPVDVPLAQLLPTLLQHAGQDLPDRGLLHGGWSLQRLGETPLDPSKTVLGLSIRDGEILYLRPRQAQLPELAFDDVVDAIATATRDRSSRWLAPTTRRVSLILAAVAIDLGALLTALAGPPWAAPAVLAAGVALALVLGGAVLSRAVGDGGAGVVLGYAALPWAALAGASPFGDDHGIGGFGAAALIGGAAAVMVAAVLAAVTIADHMPGLLGVAMAAFVAMLGGLLDLAAGWTGPGTAAIVLALVLAVTPLVPSAAFRLSDLPLPFIPLSADDLRKDEYVVPGPEVLRKTLVADRFVTGMAGGTAGLVAGCELLLSRQWYGAAPWLLAVAAAAVALRARLFTGRAQRVWLLSAAALGAALLAVNAAGADQQAVRLIAGIGPLLVAAVILVVAALRLPGARISPTWGRAGDIVESLLIVALVPLALAVVGLYGYVRGLAG